MTKISSPFHLYKQLEMVSFGTIPSKFASLGYLRAVSGNRRLGAPDNHVYGPQSSALAAKEHGLLLAGGVSNRPRRMATGTAAFSGCIALFVKDKPDTRPLDTIQDMSGRFGDPCGCASWITHLTMPLSGAVGRFVVLRG